MNNKIRICSICARGGSKGVPGKNIQLLMGVPLIAHSILQAKYSKLFSTIAVSSDSDEILSVSKKFGADVLIKRPAELATDEAAKLPVIQHCVSQAEQITGKIFETCVDLDATSPMRTIDDLIGSVKMLEDSKIYYSNVTTAAIARKSPYFNMVEQQPNGYFSLSKTPAVKIIRRQDSPVVYDMNASIYVWHRNELFKLNTVIAEKTGIFVMPAERSVDIDAPIDFKWVEFIIKETGFQAPWLSK